MKNPLSNQEILQIIRDKAKELGRTPTRREVGMWNTIYNRFGSWNNALVEAGLIPKVLRGLSKQEIIEIVKKWAKEHNKTPSISDWNKAKKNGEYLPEVRAMQRKLGMTWNQIIQLAGLEVNVEKNFYSHYTDTELLNILKKETKRVGTIDQKKFDKLRNKATVPSVTFYRTHFNKSWIQILVDIGYSKKQLSFYSYSQKELINILQEFSKKIGHTPTLKDLNDAGYSEAQFKNKFGSWNNAIKYANLNINSDHSNVAESKEELLQMYINFSNKIGRPASVRDLDNSKEIYNSYVFAQRFGGISNLKEIAGFSSIEGNKKYTKSQIIKLLLAKSKEKGRKLYQREIEIDKTLPCVKTICQYFHTTKMSDVWKKLCQEKNKI